MIARVVAAGALEEDGSLIGHIYFHLGDDSGFRASRSRDRTRAVRGALSRARGIFRIHVPTPITCQLFPARPSTMLTDQPASRGRGSRRHCDPADAAVEEYRARLDPLDHEVVSM